MTIYEKNMAKIQELLPECHYAATEWLRTCWGLNKQFRITEAYRTQQRQNELYAKGRTKPGPIVTWTKDSTHTKRLAVDIVPIRCTFEQLEAIGKQFGLYRPPELVKLGDLGHIQLDRCIKPPKVSPTEAKRRLKRMAELEKDPKIRARLLSRLIPSV